MRIGRVALQENPKERYWAVFSNSEPLRACLLSADPFVRLPKPQSYDWTIDQLILLPPCTPTKVIGIARNYTAHAREMETASVVLTADEPVIFIKPPSSL